MAILGLLWPSFRCTCPLFVFQNDEDNDLDERHSVQETPHMWMAVMEACAMKTKAVVRLLPVPLAIIPLVVPLGPQD